jgi:ribosomal protein S18 acetylase RimI-like enzyme
VQLSCDRPELADGRSRAYVYSFRVRRPYRGAGLGTRLMEVVEDDLRRRRFSHVTLNVAKDNPRARELYQRLGYAVTAHEPGRWSYPDHNGVWQHVHEPAWRMEKEL